MSKCLNGIEKSKMTKLTRRDKQVKNYEINKNDENDEIEEIVYDRYLNFDNYFNKIKLNFRAKSEINTATILLIMDGIFSKRQNLFSNAAIPQNILQISLGSSEFPRFLLVTNRPIIWEKTD